MPEVVSTRQRSRLDPGSVVAAAARVRVNDTETRSPQLPGLAADTFSTGPAPLSGRSSPCAAAGPVSRAMAGDPAARAKVDCSGSAQARVLVDASTTAPVCSARRAG